VVLGCNPAPTVRGGGKGTMLSDEKGTEGETKTKLSHICDFSMK
jgi:hypothetical protein